MVPVCSLFLFRSENFPSGLSENFSGLKTPGLSDLFYLIFLTRIMPLIFFSFWTVSGASSESRSNSV